MPSYAFIRFHTLLNAFIICFHMLWYAFIRFHTLSYAFIYFHTLSYVFICFHTLSYAFKRFHLLSNAFIYASLRFCMLSYAFTMLYKLLHALEAKVSQQQQEARCSAVYRLFLRKPVKNLLQKLTKHQVDFIFKSKL